MTNNTQLLIVPVKHGKQLIFLRASVSLRFN